MGMKTLAEYFGFRPTRFLPNGCGAGATGKLVPDEVAGANFDDCCDLHDLAYHVGRGGFLGLFYAKPAADWALMRCMDKQFARKTALLSLKKRWFATAGVFLLGTFVPPAYFLGLTLLGWTPLTWPWKERPMPSEESLRALKEKSLHL